MTPHHHKPSGPVEFDFIQRLPARLPCPKICRIQMKRLLLTTRVAIRAACERLVNHHMVALGDEPGNDFGLLEALVGGELRDRPGAVSHDPQWPSNAVTLQIGLHFDCHRGAATASTAVMGPRCSLMLLQDEYEDRRYRTLMPLLGPCDAFLLSPKA
jgi:hypothetical protein